MSSWRDSSSPKLLNLSAAQPRSGDPEIDQQHKGNTTLIRITNFTPGTLLEFEFMGSFPQEQLPAGGKPAVTVTGKGKIIEGDPRAIALVRFIS